MKSTLKLDVKDLSYMKGFMVRPKSNNTSLHINEKMGYRILDVTGGIIFTIINDKGQRIKINANNFKCTF